ncbi:hypothetical protein HaLaN_32861, partial [Haematococcus lacustris]
GPATLHQAAEVSPRAPAQPDRLAAGGLRPHWPPGTI